MDKLMNLYTRIINWLLPDLYLVDNADNYVLFYGSLEECEQARDQTYGGALSIVTHNELTDEQHQSLARIQQDVTSHE